MQTRSILLLTVALAAVAVDVTVAEVKPPTGFRALFNEMNLDGWHGWRHDLFSKRHDLTEAEFAEQTAKLAQDARQNWSVENGELVNDGHGTYLATNDEFRDFELRLEYKTVARADSGIYLKATPQVQIWDYTDPDKFRLGADLGSGGLWNNSPGSRGKDPLVLADRPLGEWNSFRIVQVGERTSVWLNDSLVVDNVIFDHYYDRENPLPVRGPVILQTHGGEIRWRHIYIRELTPEEANAVLVSHRRQAFTSLFNGRDFQGWHGMTDSYEVIDGSIQCRKGHGGLLLTADEYANFAVRLEFRLPPGGNNGLAIRSPAEGDAAYGGMCELQVLDSDHPRYAGSIDPRQAHGSIYGMVAATPGYLRSVGEWNFQEVTVDGSRILVELNGTVILDADLNDVTEYMGNRLHPGKDRTAGYFGFSGHNDPVAFRNIAIRLLPDSLK